MEFEIVTIKIKHRQVRKAIHKVIVDDEDAAMVNSHTWGMVGEYVAWTQKVGKTSIKRYLYRMLMNPSKDLTVDHINHNKLDNRRSNLRVCTLKENNKNRKVQNLENCTSKYKGVWWNKKRNIWTVQISINNKTTYVGVSKNEEEAAKLYDNAVRKHYGKFAATNFKTLEEQFNDCLSKAKEKVQQFKDEFAPSSIFGNQIPVNGGSYAPPTAEPMAQVLASYDQYLPKTINDTAATMPGVAQQTYNAVAQTQPQYNQLNLDQLQQFGLPTAQVGQQIADSNAQAGAATNLKQLTGAGGDAARAAYQVNRDTNPDYYQAADAATSGAARAVNAIDLNGLSPGEAAATERSSNNSNSGTGNLGLSNNTNTIKNAMDFGGAFNSKVGLLNNATNSASGAAAATAGNGGFNGVNVALGQPNVSTNTNFGTGTFTNTNANTGAANASNTLGFGSNLLNQFNSQNNASIGANASLGNANSTSAILGSIPSYS